MDHIVTFGEGGQVYLYEHVAPGDDGVLEAQAVVIMKRPHGFMVALPADVLTAEEVRQGEHASMEAEVGPSFQAQVAAAQLTDEGLVPQPGVSVPCLIVDFGALAAPRFSPFVGQEPEILFAFDQAMPNLFPEPSALLQQALTWAQRPETPQERVAFYSAEEGPPPHLESAFASQRTTRLVQSLGLPVQAEALFYQSRRGPSG